MKIQFISNAFFIVKSNKGKSSIYDLWLNDRAPNYSSPNMHSELQFFNL